MFCRFYIHGKNVRPPNLSLPSHFCFSLRYCQFIERAICWCASLRQEPDALSDRLDASDPQWLAPVRRTGGSSTGMLGPPLWRTGILPPRSSVGPSQPNAYLNYATAYKDTHAPNRMFNQVQMPHESKTHYRETFHPASVCTINEIHWRLYSTRCCVYPKERCFSKQFHKNAVSLYSPELYKFNMKSKFYFLKTSLLLLLLSWMINQYTLFGGKKIFIIKICSDDQQARIFQPVLYNTAL